MKNEQAEMFCLNPEYSTPRMVTKEQPIIENDPSSKVRTQLFLPSHPQRQGEGGLRTKGCFKRNIEGKPLVTIITIVYNRSKYMAQTIESVLGQSYPNVEYIIIDAGSADGTVDIVKKYGNAIDYWISEPDEGISDAFNKGVVASTGKWLNFMNCADRYASSDAIEEFVSHFDSNADIIFGRGNVVDSSGKIIITAGNPLDQKKFCRRMTIPHQSAFHNCDYFRKYGLFDKQFKAAMVYELLLRKRPLSTVFIDKTISNMLAGGVHESADYLRLREARTVKRKHCSDVGALIIAFDYWYGLARALMKRALNRIGLRSITRKIRQFESKLK